MATAPADHDGDNRPRPEEAAEEAAEDAASHRSTRILARSGLAARGIVYLIAAFVAGQIALGSVGEPTRASGHGVSGPGAVHTLAGGFGGRVSLFALAVGLAGYVVFSLLDTVLHHNEADKSALRRWGERLLSLWGAVLYAAFSVWTFRVALSAHPGQSDSAKAQSQKAGLTSQVLSWPAGQFFVALIATIIAIAAIALLRRAAKREFLNRYDPHRVPRRSWKALTVLGICGIASRALAYGVVAGMIMTAAISDDPRDGQGLDGSLRAVAARPWGPYLLFPIALGLFCFGVYLFFEARYRRVGSGARAQARTGSAGRPKTRASDAPTRDEEVGSVA